MLSSGTKIILGVTVTLCASSDGSMQIERIEVPKEKRHQGLAAAALKQLADEAKKQGVNLFASICPDYDTKDFAITAGLRRAFERAGFSPLEMDGEVYRNDVELYCNASAMV